MMNLISLSTIVHQLSSNQLINVYWLKIYEYSIGIEVKQSSNVEQDLQIIPLYENRIKSTIKMNELILRTMNISYPSFFYLFHLKIITRRILFDLCSHQFFTIDRSFAYINVNIFDFYDGFSSCLL
jgi:hypothetical protein